MINKIKIVKCIILAILLSFVSCSNSIPSDELSWLDEYDVVWSSQSRNSGGSMPCGGGDIGMNVWVEDGDILFYMERSGNIDERDQLLKTGRFRIELTPSPFAEDGRDVEFAQRLDLESGAVLIEGKSETNSTNIKIWAEVYRPVVHIEIDCETPTTTTATFESWRFEKQLIPYTNDGKTDGGGKDSNRWASYGYCTYLGDVYSYADQISHKDSSVLFYHRNNNDDLIFDKEVKVQGLDNVIDEMRHPTKDRIFGGVLEGEGMVAGATTEGVYAKTPFKGWQIKSSTPTKSQNIKITLHTDQTPNLEEWIEALDSRCTEDISLEQAWHKNSAWWHEFWNRSYIRINSGRGATDIGWQVGRNYQLMRYILALNYYGEFPTRFNGGLLTYDPLYVDGKDGQDPSYYNPDYRKWGAWTGMNQRLVHWPMLKSGDFEAMLPQFNFYRDNYINGYLRNRESFGIEAPSYAEQCGSGGLPTGSHYGWEPPYGKRSENAEKGMEQSMHKYYYHTQLEFVYMMYEWHRFTGNDLSEYMPFMQGSLNFIFDFLKMLQRRRDGNDWGEDGKLVMINMNSTESYKPGSNPLPEVMALNTNIKALLSLPDKWVNQEYKEQLKDWAKRVPATNYRIREGRKTYSPLLEVNAPFGNREIPQLYPVFPYGHSALGQPELEVGRDTWLYGLDSVHNNYIAWVHGNGAYPQRLEWWGWGQQCAMAARLGFTDDAKYYASKKLANANGMGMMTDTKYWSHEYEFVDTGDLTIEEFLDSRFPAFWGEGYGCKPSMEWGAAGMVGLQEMLLQTISNEGEDLRIYPAWPTDWDVTFKLHAPHNTTVESSMWNGEIEEYNVTPKSRERDLILPE